MAINIQNIIDQITAKAAAADSTDTADYLLTLSKAVLAMNNATGVIEYRAKSQLPTVDSSILGNFAYIAAGYDIDSVYADSYAGFYYAARIGSNDSGWDRIRTGKDSDAEVAALPVPTGTQAQGSISGYSSGGLTAFPPSNVIEKFSFTSDGNATDVGDLTSARSRIAGQSSDVSGYNSGGDAPPNVNIIDKFPFSVDANATDVGDLIIATSQKAGQSSTTHGYATGGAIPPPYSNVIEKFPFSADANSSDVGDITVARRIHAGQSSENDGYSSGGISGTPPYNVIDKFPFATDANATDVGDLVTAVYNVTGQNSSTHGYTSGGVGTPATPTGINVIQKFSFTVDGNSTDVGDLTGAVFGGSGTSSTTNGYLSGGQNPGYINTIQKHPFTADANATDVGDLTESKTGQGGQQV